MKSIQNLFRVCAGMAAPVLFVTAAHAAIYTAQGEKPKHPDGSTHADMKPDMKKGGPCVCLSNDVLGTKVISTQGEKLGTIEDVVVNPSGEVAYAVVSFGGVMGVGDKYFAVPWSVLRSDASKQTSTKEKSSDRAFVLPLDKEKLKNAPGFDKAHWPAMANADWAKDVDAFYAGTPSKELSRSVEASARSSGPIWKCSELKGFDVQSPSGEKLGDIKEVSIDTNGHVCYAVVSVGGFLGMGDRLVPVPWAALKTARDASGDKRTIILSSTKDQLKAAPQFDDSKDKRAEMCDPQWIGRVYEYYSVRPYWSRTEGE